MAMDSRNILEFTYAEYPSDQKVLGLSMVFLSFVPHLIGIYTISVMIHSKCFKHFSFLLGLLLSHESAKYLKRFIRQPRPEGTILTSYGMPSDHSMFVFFATVYTILLLRSRPSLRTFSFLLSSTVMVTFASLVCYSRYFLNAHTVEQISVGATLGSLLAPLWFHISQRYLTERSVLHSVFTRFLDSLHALFLGSSLSKHS